MTAAEAAIRWAVAADLPGAHQQSKRATLTDEVVALAVGHRVQGLLWRAVETGAVSGGHTTEAHARSAFDLGLRTCLIAEATAVLAVDALSEAGVEARALKGAALAHLDYNDPSHRMFGDADILIQQEAYRAALHALKQAGFRRAQPPHRLGWERRFGKGVTFVSPRGSELDLHLRITGGYFGEVIDHRRLWAADSPQFVLAGRTVGALARPGRLLNACCHAVLGGASGLRALYDVALLASSGNDWSTTVTQARRDGVDLVVAQAIQRTWTELGLSMDQPAAVWAMAHQPDRHQVAALSSYSTAASVPRSAEDRGVLTALSRVDRLRYLAGLAFPPRENLSSRGRSYRGHLSLGWRTLRGGRSP